MAASLSPAEEWRFPNRATPPGSSAYYSLRLAPAPLRDPLALLLAWRHAIRAVPEECSDPGVARLKLGWWREELERLLAGAPRHPLTQGLAPLLDRWNLPGEPFAAMIETLELELRGEKPASLADLEARVRADMGALFELMGRCHGAATEERLEPLRRLGAGCALVYLIRDLGAPGSRGPKLLPREIGIPPPESARKESARGLEIMGERARDLLRRERADIPACLAARAAILERLLNSLEQSGYDVLGGRMGLTPWYKLWVGWRASLQTRPQLP